MSACEERRRNGAATVAPFYAPTPQQRSTDRPQAHGGPPVLARRAPRLPTAATPTAAARAQAAAGLREAAVHAALAPVLWDVPALWTALLAHCTRDADASTSGEAERQNGNANATVSGAYGELRLSFEGYKAFSAEMRKLRPATAADRAWWEDNEGPHHSHHHHNNTSNDATERKAVAGASNGHSGPKKPTPSPERDAAAGDASASDGDSDAQRAFFSHPLLSPAPFLAQERRPSDGTVAAAPLFASLARAMLLAEMHGRLALLATPPKALGLRQHQRRERDHGAGRSDTEGSDEAVASAAVDALLAPAVLTADAIESFIAGLLPQLRLVRDQPPWMAPYYLCHAAQRFVFALDPRKADAIPCSVVLRSEPLASLLALYERDYSDAFVAFPPGALVDVPEALLTVAAREALVAKTAAAGDAAAAASDDEAPLVRCRVASYDGEGSAPSDTYTLAVVALDGACDAAAPTSNGGASAVTTPTAENGCNGGENGHDAPPRRRDRRSPETAPFSPAWVDLPRECVHWCDQTTAALAPEALDGQRGNWFSLPVASTVYAQFTLLDRDGDGLLSPDELLAYNDGSFTGLAVSRVFDVHCSGYGGGRMNYKQFLDFVLATEHPNAVPAARYLWALVDLQGAGSRGVSTAVLRFFCREVAVKLEEAGLMKVTADSILAEVVDMINPPHGAALARALPPTADGITARISEAPAGMTEAACPASISLDDVLRSGHHGTILPVLLDWRAFYLYDCREQLASHATEAAAAAA